jgi:hypothetical protein
LRGIRGFLITVFDGFGFVLITERANSLVDIGGDDREIICARRGKNEGRCKIEQNEI